MPCARCARALRKYGPTLSVGDPNVAGVASPISASLFFAGRIVHMLADCIQTEVELDSVVSTSVFGPRHVVVLVLLVVSS